MVAAELLDPNAEMLWLSALMVVSMRDLDLAGAVRPAPDTVKSIGTSFLFIDSAGKPALLRIEAVVGEAIEAELEVADVGVEGTGATTAALETGTGATTEALEAGTGAATAALEAGTGAATAALEAGTGAATAALEAGTATETAALEVADTSTFETWASPLGGIVRSSSSSSLT